LPGDLHTHTTFSDGSLPIHLLPLLAKRAGLSWLAVSDHDSVQSVRYAYEHPCVDGVSLIPATELSTFDPVRGRRVHLLAYWPQICPALETHCAEMAKRRNAACLQSVKELEAIYPQFSADMALAHAEASGVLFKSGIMNALCALGIAESIYGDVYHQLFGSPGGIVLHKPGYDPLDTVLETLKACKAVVVLAHPSVYQSMDLARQLAAAGRIDGIEIEHPRNTKEDQAACRALCAQYGLIETGGTDFHGANSGHPHPLGTCTTADEQIARIGALAKKRQAV
jgi:predicted metal-dependent phosphoesterase TrpH